jgi:hypothetical protein
MNRVHGVSITGSARAHRLFHRAPVEPEKYPHDDKRCEHAVEDGVRDLARVDSRHRSSPCVAGYDAPMTEAKTATGARVPGWVRFVLALWAIAALLLALQSLELKLFEAAGG